MAQNYIIKAIPAELHKFLKIESIKRDMSLKEYIYFGIFNDGKLLFRVWNRIPKNDMNIVIADRLCALAEGSLSPVLRDGDYIAFDYERGR